MVTSDALRYSFPMRPRVRFLIRPFVLTTVVVACHLSQAAPAAAQAPRYLLQWGSCGSGAGQFSGPLGVAADLFGHVFVIDQARPAVDVYDGSGIYLGGIGAFGVGPGQYQSPYTAGCDPFGNIYITDASHDRVVKFRTNGTYVLAFGSSGSGAGQFTAPKGIVADSAGDVFVVDTGNSRVEKFDSTGTFVMQWGSPGAGNGQFNLPYFMALGSGHVLYVVDAFNNRVQMFDLAGNYLGQFDGFPGTPIGVATDPLGRVFVTTSSNVQAYDSSGAFLVRWGSSGSGPGQFGGAYGIATDAAGNIYVLDAGYCRVEKFGPLTTDVPASGSTALSLAEPVPNPSRGATMLRYALPRTELAELSVFDVTGQRVRRLLGGTLPAGSGAVTWDGRDDGGRVRASGLYFARLRTADGTRTERVMLTR